MINPYNFVRSDKPMPRGEPIKHHRLCGRSGTITCRLETLTPIFTPSPTYRSQVATADLSFFKIDRRPALPGSSLKGMLRSLAETICNGCSPFVNPCYSLDHLCPACRTFGYLKGGEVHAGHVNISDGLVEDGFEMGTRIALKALSNPKPERHGPFYDAAKRERGRKFYYHQQHVCTENDIPTEANPTHLNARIEPLLHGIFHFTVRYWNIDETELGLLLHAIELPPELYHKFGMAKPLGLGTVRLRIVGWRETNPTPGEPASRYQSFDASGVEIAPQQGEGQISAEQEQHLREHLHPLQQAYARKYSRVLGQNPPIGDLWGLPAKNIADLRIMLSLVDYSREIRYPSYEWFDVHGAVHLPTVQEVHSGARLPHNNTRR